MKLTEGKIKEAQKVQDIIKQLAKASPSDVTPDLLTEIHERLTEAERLQRENGKMSRQIAEDSIKLMVFNEVCQERDELRAQLETAVSHLNAIVKNIPQGEVEIAREVWGNTNTRIISDSLVAADGWLRNRDAQ